jgi:hypothetical protein
MTTSKKVSEDNNFTDGFKRGDLVTHDGGETVKMYLGMSDTASDRYGTLFKYVMVYGVNIGQYGEAGILAAHKKFYGVIELTSE